MKTRLFFMAFISSFMLFACSDTDFPQSAIDAGPDRSDPIVVITAPAQYGIVSDTVRIRVDITDESDISRVIFIIDGDSIAAVTQAPYEYTGAFRDTNDSHTIFVKALDSEGNEGLSQLITVYTVADVVAPVVVITAPAQYQQVADSVHIRVAVTDRSEITRVTFWIDGDSVASLTRPPYELPWVFTAGNASHTIRASALDASGNPGASQLVNVYTVMDLIPPIVVITRPGAGMVVNGVTDIHADASDNTGVAEVVFFINGDSVYSDAQAPYQFSWTFDRAQESHTLLARAYDQQRNVGISNLVTVYSDSLDYTPPVVVITAPTTLDTLSGSVPILTQATDNVGVQRVEFFIDGVLAGTVIAPPFDWIWPTLNETNDWHTVLAKAFDHAGHSSISQLNGYFVEN